MKRWFISDTHYLSNEPSKSFSAANVDIVLAPLGLPLGFPDCPLLNWLLPCIFRHCILSVYTINLKEFQGICKYLRMRDQCYLELEPSNLQQ